MWNPRVHYLSYNRPPLVPIVSQMNPVHALISCVFNCNFNIILQSSLKSSKRYPFFRVSYKKRACSSLHPPARPIHVTCPAQSDHTRSVSRGGHMVPLNMTFSSGCLYFLPAMPKFSQLHHIQEHGLPFILTLMPINISSCFSNSYVLSEVCVRPAGVLR